MAPRRRPGKKNTRIEAALDAMRPYGFREDLVLEKLKELLNVYGEEHWFFIEENSYKVLIEAILEQVEREERQSDEAIYGSSSGALALAYSDLEASNIALPSNRGVVPASQTDDTALLTYKSDCNDHLPPSGEESGLQKTLYLNSGEGLRRNNIETEDPHLGGFLTENTNLSSAHANQSQKPMDGFPPRRRRRPYHGWISDGEDQPVLVELKPAPLPPEIADLLFGRDVNGKRKTRWDMRPEDM